MNNTSTNVSNHYILDTQDSDLLINISGYTSGIYSVSLVVDGVYRDFKTFTIY
ncbi:MAG: hypothetical protein HND54_04320 [Bacteroidetes bacterium]|nr:hypothetical protein [Bacteroidota bacterium]